MPSRVRQRRIPALTFDRGIAASIGPAGRPLPSPDQPIPPHVNRHVTTLTAPAPRGSRTAVNGTGYREAT